MILFTTVVLPEPVPPAIPIISIVVRFQFYCREFTKKYSNSRAYSYAIYCLIL